MPSVRAEARTAAPACIGDFEVTPREGGHAHNLPFLPIPIDPKRVAAEPPVRDLNFDLKRLQAAARRRARTARARRASYALAQAADTLHELGVQGPAGDRAAAQARGGAGARVEAPGTGPFGTMKNRTAHIRWWAKRVGRPREVPVRNDAQRALLDEARRLVGSGALIPPQRNYRQQLKVYESQTREAGLYRMHGLRHLYALTRYEEITGWKAPDGGRPAAANAHGGEAADRHCGAADDRAGARPWPRLDLVGLRWGVIVWSRALRSLTAKVPALRNST